MGKQEGENETDRKVMQTTVGVQHGTNIQEWMEEAFIQQSTEQLWQTVIHHDQ